MSALGRKIAAASVAGLFFACWEAPAQEPVQVWRQDIFASGDTDSMPSTGEPDFGGRAAAIDANGNTIVTGRSFNGFAQDFLTVKYDPNGNVLWRAVVQSGEFRNNAATAVAVDAAGNSYVTGKSYLTSNSGAEPSLYLTVKYDASGVEKWRAVADGGTGIADFARAISVDSGGSVYVTGISEDYSAYLTIKYSPSGIEQWRRQARRSATSFQDAIGLAMDSGGNIIITGYAMEAGARMFFTVKYSSSGAELWRLASDANGMGAVAFDVTTDAANNVYLTGAGAATPETSAYLTIKLDSAGTELWRAVMSAGSGSIDTGILIRIDAGGNAVVTGASYDGVHTVPVTVKYSNGGAELWRRVGNLPASQNARPFGLAAASDGGITVASNQTLASERAILTIKYDASGTEQWRHLLPAATNPGVYGFSLNLTPAGETIIAAQVESGPINRDFRIVRLDASGAERWRAAEGVRDRLALTATSARGLRRDAAGNLYIAGRAPAAGTLLSKRSTAGDEIWRALLPSVANIAGMDLDAAGNVLVFSTTSSVATGNDWLLLKYNPDGTALWQATLDGARHGEEIPGGLAVTPAGEAYTAGTVETATGRDIFTVKYAADGTELWRRSLTGFSGTSVAAATLDGGGNIIVAGTIAPNRAYERRDITIKYDAAGNELWRNLSTGNTNDPLSDPIALDAAGNVYRASFPAQTGNESVSVLERIDAAGGTAIWRTELRDFGVSAIALDAAGNAYLIGGLSSASSQLPGIIKLNPAGGEQWRTSLVGAAEVNLSSPTLVAIDQGGNPHIASISQSPTFEKSQIVQKLDSSGAEQWRLTEPVLSGFAAAVPSISLDGAGSMVVLSNTATDTRAPAITVTRYSLPAPPFGLVAAHLRKSHCAAGVFDLPVRKGAVLAGPVSVEPRTVAGGFELVLSFNSAVASTGVIAAFDVQGAGVTVGAAVIAGNEIHIALPAPPEDGRVQVNISGTNGVLNASLAIGFFAGDANGSRSVTAADLSAMKVRQSVTTRASNAAFDINADGAVDTQDLALMRARAGSLLR